MTLLASLLEHEREALLTGQFELLGEIAEQKEQALAILEGRGEICGDMLEALRMNLRLLGAARAGFESGRQRLAELERVQSGFYSYDANGASLNVFQASKGVSKTI